MRTMPMFPLGSVLLPHMVLPLHVFEPRYRALVADVLAGDRRFGVVLIDRGHEVGGADQRSDLGTVAEVLEAVELDDGRWAVVAVGTDRLRVQRWLEDDPYPLAEVELLDDVDDPGDDESRAAVLRDDVAVRLRRLLGRAAELGDAVAPATTDIAEDPTIASYHATALAPLGPLDRQRLLAFDDPLDRLTALLASFEEIEQELALRLAMLADDEEQP